MIGSILFIIIFISLPITWIFMLRLASINLRKLSIPGILILSILIFQYFGYPVLFFNLDINRNELINDNTILIKAFFWSSLTITLLILGFIIARKNFGPMHYKNEFSKMKSSVPENILIHIIFLFGLFVLLNYINKIGFSKIALFAVLDITETGEKASYLRSEMGNNFSGKYHWYSLFMRDFVQLSSLAFFARYISLKSILSLVTFIISFIVTSFSMTISIEKGPFMWYLVSLFMVYILIKNKGYFSLKKILITLPFFLLIIGFIYVQFMGASDVYIGFKSAFSRILTGQIQGVYHYLCIFPEKKDFLLGLSMPNPGGIFPWEPFRLTVEVMNIVFPNNNGVVGSMPTFFWGEMYANFSYLGILIPPVFIGILLYWFNFQFIRLQSSPLIVAAFVWFVLHFRILSGTGLSKYFLDINAFFMCFILTIFFLFCRKGKIIINKYKNKL